MTTGATNILYLVHDLTDAAVEKRVAMLRDGGADNVQVAGFCRTETAPDDVVGCPAFNFGRTYNGGFVQRILSVVREALLLSRHRDMFAKADIVMARNLEMLALAVRGRALCADKDKPVIIYESLDIHRLLLNEGGVGKILRGLEGWLARRAAGLITSSPAFITQYFEALSQVRLPVKLVENKVYGLDESAVKRAVRPMKAPWRIGWFGALRCKKSFKILTDLARAYPGVIEVIIRGKPAYDQMPDFDEIVKNTPGVIYGGPYKNPDDLAAIYGEIHFTWAIDMFEEGLNSSWLLPNRLYEGGLYGAVPLARAGVETGAVLDGLGIGVRLDDPLDEHLAAFFAGLTPEGYNDLAEQSAAVPLARWLCTSEESRNLVNWLKEKQG